MRKLATASYQSPDNAFLSHDDLPEDLIADFFSDSEGLSLTEVHDMSVLSQVPELLNQVRRIIALRVDAGATTEPAQDIALFVFSGLEAIDCFSFVRSQMAVAHVDAFFQSFIQELSTRMSAEIEAPEQAFLDALAHLTRSQQAA